MKIHTKLLTALIAILFLLAGCQQKNREPEKEYVEPNRDTNLLYINAEIRNITPGTMVVFYRLNPKSGVAEYIARKNVQKEKFLIPVKVTEPTFYLMAIGGQNRQVPLLLNKSDVEVRADFTNFPLTLSAIGCRDTELLFKLQNIRKRLAGKRGQLPPEKFAELREKEITDFIDQALPSVISIAAIASLPIEEYEEEYEELAEELGEIYPEAATVKAFQESFELKRKLKKGARLADQELPVFQGDTIQLSDLRGKYVLLDFWKSTYPNIEKDNALLKQVYARYNNELEIVGISMDESPRTWEQGIQNLPWKHVRDVVPNEYYSTIASKYGYFSLEIPFTILLDREGRIIEKGIRGIELGMRMQKLLAEEKK